MLSHSLCAVGPCPCNTHGHRCSWPGGRSWQPVSPRLRTLVSTGGVPATAAGGLLTHKLCANCVAITPLDSATSPTPGHVSLHTPRLGSSAQHTTTKHPPVCARCPRATRKAAISTATRSDLGKVMQAVRQHVPLCVPDREHAAPGAEGGAVHVPERRARRRPVGVHSQ